MRGISGIRNFIFIAALALLVVFSVSLISDDSSAEDEYNVLLITGDSTLPSYSVVDDCVNVIKEFYYSASVKDHNVTCSVSIMPNELDLNIVRDVSAVYVILPSDDFEESIAETLSRFIVAGGYVVLIGDSTVESGQSNAYLNSLISSMGYQMEFNSSSVSGTNILNEEAPVIYTDGGRSHVSSLTPLNPSLVASSSSNGRFISKCGDGVWANEIYTTNGSLFAFNDTGWLLDGPDLRADAEPLLQNILKLSTDRIEEIGQVISLIEFQTFGGIIEDKIIKSYIEGVETSLPMHVSTTALNSAFDGWYLDSGYTQGPYDKISQYETGDKVYYAKWSEPTMVIGNKYYCLSTVAFNDFNSEDDLILTILKDVTFTETAVISVRGTLDINGFTITGSGNGSVLRITSAGSLLIKDSRMDNARTYVVDSNGKYVPSDAGQIVLYGGVITGGYANDILNNPYGGGICVEGTINIDNLNIMGNRALAGGGLYISSLASINITKLSIADNKAIRNQLFLQNTNGCGGGILISNNSAEIRNVLVHNNTADADGGGLYLDGTNNIVLKLIDSGFYNNSSSNGGGIFSNRVTSSIELDSVEITWNVVSSNGGGIYSNGPVSMTSTKIDVNQSGSSGGGIYCRDHIEITHDNTIRNNKAVVGGGIYCTQSINIAGTSITDNEISNNTASDSGGGIYSNLALSVDGCTISGNIASNSGGGIYSISFLELHKCYISKNSSTMYGGGFHIRGDLLLNGAEIYQNSAPTGASGFITDGNSTIFKGTFHENTSSNDTQALYIRSTTISIKGDTEIFDGIMLYYSEVFISETPTFYFKDYQSRAIYLDKDSLIHGCDANHTVYYQGSLISAEAENDLMVDGAVIFYDVDDPSKFVLSNMDPKCYLWYDSSYKQLVFAFYEALITNTNTYYEFIDDAIYALLPNQTLKLLKDVTVNVPYTVSSSSLNTIIDGQNYTLTDASPSVSILINGGALTLKDIRIHSKDQLKNSFVECIQTGALFLSNAIIDGYDVAHSVIHDGTDAPLLVTIESSQIRDNKVNAGSGIYLTEPDSAVAISGDCYINDNLVYDQQCNIYYFDSKQLILAGNLTGTVGINFNNYVSKTFGVSLANYSGAQYFISDRNEAIIGSISEGKLIWEGKLYNINYYLYDDNYYVEQYQHGQVYYLPTTFKRKGFEFVLWTDGMKPVTEISAGDYGMKMFYAVWDQKEYFVSNLGNDSTGDGTDVRPFATIGKAYSVIPTGLTITLLSDITIDTTVTFDLDKKVLVTSHDDYYTITRGLFFTNTLFNISNDTIVFEHLTIDGGGEINNRAVTDPLVKVSGYSDVTFDGVTLRNNYVLNETGSEDHPFVAGILATNNASVYLKGESSITENQSYNASAVYLADGSMLIMCDASIEYNIAPGDNNGGAVVVSTGAKLILDTKVKIRYNVYGYSPSQTNANVILKESAMITISATLDESSAVYVSTEVTPTLTADVMIVQTATVTDSQHFYSDNPNYNILFCDGTENTHDYYPHTCHPGSIWLSAKEIHTHSFTASYEFTEDYLNATVTLTCECGEVVSAYVPTVPTVIVEIKCTVDGVIKYTASFTYGTQTYIGEKIVTTPAPGHDFDRGYCTVCHDEDMEDSYIIRLTETTKYKTMLAAYDDITTSGTMYVIKDFTFEKNFVIQKNITIESYGSNLYTISRGYTGIELMSVYDGYELTLKNIIFDGKSSDCRADGGAGIVSVYGGSVLNITDGTTITNFQCDPFNHYSTIFVNDGSVHLFGGSITGNKSVLTGAAIYAANTGKIYINGPVYVRDNYMGDAESNITMDTYDQLIFNGDLTGGDVGVHFGADLIDPLGVYIAGTGYSLITSDYNHNRRANLREGILIWVEDYIVYLFANYGDPTPWGQIIATYMSPYGYLPDCSKEGYTFTGWYLTDTSTDRILPETIVTITSSHRLYAHWAINSYTITFDTAGGDPIEPITAEYNSELDIPDATKVGHTFLGWNPAAPERMPAQNITLTALWSVNWYTIKFNTEGGSDVKSIYQAYGTAITVPSNPIRVGYEFSNWNPLLPSTMPAYNLTVTAVWNVNSYTIVFNTNGGSYIAPITVNYNTEVQHPPTPTKAGYTFNNWAEVFPNRMPAYDITLNALWIPNMYKIVFDTDGGTAVPTIWEYCDTPVGTVPNPSKPGYEFLGWDQPIPDVIPAYNMTIKALWQASTHTPYSVIHTVENNKGVYVEDTIDTMYGTTGEYTTVVLNTYPDHIEGVYEPQIISPSGYTTVTVYYEYVKYIVHFDSNGGTETNDQKVIKGNTAYKPYNVTKSGYILKYWALNGSPYDFTTPVTNDIVLTAVWGSPSMTVTVYSGNDSVSGAKVYIQSGSDTIVTGTSDIEGMITFNNVPFGYLNVTVEKDGRTNTDSFEVTDNLSVSISLLDYNKMINVEEGRDISISNFDNCINTEDYLNKGERFDLIFNARSVETPEDVRVLETYDLNIKKLTYKSGSSDPEVSTVSTTYEMQTIALAITPRVLNYLDVKGYGYDHIDIYHYHETNAGEKVTKMLKKATYEEFENSLTDCFCIHVIENKPYIMLKTTSFSLFDVYIAKEPVPTEGTGNDIALLVGLIAVAFVVPIALIGVYLYNRKKKSGVQ